MLRLSDGIRREWFRRALDADGGDQFSERWPSSRCAGNIVDIYVLFRATSARVRVSQRHAFLKVLTFIRVNGPFMLQYIELYFYVLFLCATRFFYKFLFLSVTCFATRS